MPENLLDSPILYSLALTLLHFLWQGCLLALVLKCLLSSTSYKNPQLRYFWSTITLITCLIVPIITFSIIYTPDYLNIGPQGLEALELFDSNQPNSVINSDWYQTAVDSLPFLSLAWLITVIISSVKLLFALRQVNQLPTNDTIAVNSTLQLRFEQLISQFKLWRKPQLLISLKTEVPMAIGWLKPVILLPASMMTGLTSTQLEMLILHELAHVKRHDYLVNFLQTLVEILLFFHPGVRWISKQMRYEREYCSDDIAVKHCGNAIAYAHTLADTASLCHKHRQSSIPAMAMAASGGDLKQRVVRLIDNDHTCTVENDSGKLLASIVILFAILSVFAKPFVDNSMIDWGSGRISLVQSAGEFIQHKVNEKEQPLAQTTLAQQLVEQNTPNSDMASANKDVFLTQQDAKTSRTTSEELLKTPRKIIDLKEQTVPNEQPLAQVSTKRESQKAELVSSQKDQESLSKVIETPDINLLANTTNGSTQQTKSISEMAFERSDSSNSEAKFKNPYANQLASLVEEPLPSIDKAIELNNTYTQAFNQPLPKQENIHTNKNIEYRNAPIQKSSAQLITSVEPRYPSIAKRKGIEVDVFVKFVIDKDGYVADIEFEDQNKVSYFRNAIRTAMNKWRFQPATVNEKPIDSQMAKIFSFSLIKS
ncbi:M56 family metallopeptidase [Thalassotalea profundi]|uniref:TonB C-terminal domain-containing protein n=1 Tax=Thalassotalea profundi TaxID=2036687 RepID=A0ABQ3IQN1_9GAMM|nr:M56 family metallopeptidase [Thalassotalea profundi]GHE89689.1 hypothetical protein GCM10011501_19090 [Thalassotalea profundi]